MLKRNLKVAVIAMILSLGALGCPSIQPGEDPVEVNAQRAYANTRDGLTTLFEITLANRDLIEQKLPGTVAVVKEIQKQAKLALPEFLKAIDAYKLTKDKSGLDKWQPVLAQLLESAKTIVGSLSAQGIN